VINSGKGRGGAHPTTPIIERDDAYARTMVSVDSRAEQASIRSTRAWLFAGIWVLVVGGISVVRVWALIPHVWDLGFFVHGLAAVARGGLDAVVPFAGWTVLEDHFSPLLLLLAPLSRFSWSPYLLVAIQAVAVGSSIPIAARMVSRSTDSARRVWLLTVAYALSPVLLFAAFFDIHASVLATPLLLLVFEGIDLSARRQIVVAGAAAALLREDIAFFMLVLAVFFFTEAKRAMILLGGIAALTLLVGRIVAGGRDPALTPPHVNFSYEYIDIGDPAGTVAGLVDALFAAGSSALLLLLIAVAVPWITLGRLDGKVGLYGSAVAAPFLLSQYTVTKSVASHYYFALAPILLWAVIRGGQERAPAANEHARRRLAVAGVVLGFLGGPLAFGALATSGSNTAAEIVDAALRDRADIARVHDALDCVPDEFSLAVGPELTPHVADHEMVWQWPQPVDRAVWILGGNRFELRSVDPTGRPDAIVFTRSSYSPTDFGYKMVPSSTGSGVQVFVREGVDASGISECLPSA
jgi:hypothetical protein